MRKRHSANTATRRLAWLASWGVALCIPWAIVGGTMEIVASEAFLRHEYAKPSFPPDSFGFDSKARLENATVVLEAIRAAEPPERVLLGSFPDRPRPVYTHRELEHLADVQARMRVVQRIRFGAAAIALAMLLPLLANRRFRAAGIRGIARGGAVTALLLGVGSLLALLRWDVFFVRIHPFLFPDGNWTFAWSDTLIRLFPPRFWLDASLVWGISALGVGFATAIMGFILARRYRGAAQAA